MFGAQGISWCTASPGLHINTTKLSERMPCSSCWRSEPCDLCLAAPYRSCFWPRQLWGGSTTSSEMTTP